MHLESGQSFVYTLFSLCHCYSISTSPFEFYLFVSICSFANRNTFIAFLRYDRDPLQSTIQTLQFNFLQYAWPELNTVIQITLIFPQGRKFYVFFSHISFFSQIFPTAFSIPTRYRAFFPLLPRYTISFLQTQDMFIHI